MKELKIGKAQAIGHLVCLWLWAIENAENGDLTPFPESAIARAAEWNKRAHTFIDALVKCGWADKQDKTLKLHDWDDYTNLFQSQLESQKQKTKERVRRYREKKKQVCNAECNITSNGNNAINKEESNKPVTVTVTQCNAPTVPNLYIDVSNETSCPNSNSDVMKPKNETDNFDHDSEPYKLASELSRMMHENNASAKQQEERDLQRWAKTFDLTIRRDNRTAAQIWDVMRFSQQDSFWKVNILSADALRKQFDRLTLKMEQGK